MARKSGENVGGMETSNVKGEIILQKKERTTMYKMFGPCGVGFRGWRGSVEDTGGWRRVVKEAKAHQDM
jgi:hypothetical protein